jgi:Tol biopolymer transport system component/DNA-binding winged helix-turn-helix (wHTH) protein
MSSPAAESPRSLSIAGARVEPRLNRVTIGERTVRLEPKIMDVLLALAARAGEVVSKDELLRSVWNGTYVTEDVLTRAIGELRKLFGDDPGTPHVIETIRKRGYRLIAPVIEESGEAATAPPELASVPAGHRVSRAVLVLAAGLAAAAAAWGGSRLLRAPAARAPVRVVPLTSLPGNEVDPALSPDGRRVAFAWSGPEGSGPSIWVKPVDASSPARLTHGGRDRHPVWSPDGARIVFTRWQAATCRLLEIASGGGEERELGSCGDGHDPPSRLSWSPDGAWLAMQARHPSGARGIVLVSPRTHERRFLTVPPKEIAGDEFPAFSPDGRTLAFVRSLAGGVDDVYTVPVEGGEPRRLTFDNAGVEGVEWSPDAGSLAFSSSRAGLYSLWKVPAKGGAVSWLAGGGSKLKHPAAAARRNVLAYENWIYEVNLWSVPLGRPEPAVRLTSSTDEWEFQPEVSPDGSLVAYVSTRSGSEEIWVVRRDGEEPRQVTSFQGPRVATPRFSPDGRSLVFSARPEGRADLFVVDLATHAKRRLTSDPGDELMPSFSRDGASVYFSSRASGAWEVWRVPARGGDSIRMTEGGGQAPMEAPDGSVYFVRLGEKGLWRMPKGGGAAALAVPSLAADAWAEWHPSERGIIFRSSERDDKAVVSLAPFGGGPPIELAAIEDQAWSGFSVSPDCGSLVYSRTNRRYADLKMLENPF